MAANWLIYSFTIESPTVSRQTATYVITESVSTVRGLLDGASQRVGSKYMLGAPCVHTSLYTHLPFLLGYDRSYLCTPGTHCHQSCTLKLKMLALNHLSWLNLRGLRT